MTTTKYQLRDLPLSIGDAMRLEELADGNRSIRGLVPFLERYLILPEGQTLDDVPVTDMGAIVEGILKRQGIGKQDLKPSRAR